MHENPGTPAFSIQIDADTELRLHEERYGWDPSQDLSEEERERIMDEAADDQVVVSERLMHLLLNDKASPMRDVQNKE